MSSIDESIPRIPIGEWAESGVDWLTDNAEPVFDAFETVINTLNDTIMEGLLALPAVVMALIFGLLALAARSVVFAVGSVLGFLLLISMDVWTSAMQLLSLVFIATVIAVVIGVPIGILAARSRAVSMVVRPVMDFMQTMPALVYLIPAIFFFGIGVVPGVFCTIIFALPPGVRLTELGIRQVDAETVEAGHAFGASPRQILRGIQLPLAIPTIMAGVNQVIMLALSMAVIAGFVGADGLGKDVVSSIATLNIPLGAEAGLGVVVLAIYLDRLTGALGNPREYPHSLLALLRRRRATSGATADASPSEDELTTLKGQGSPGAGAMSG